MSPFVYRVFYDVPRLLVFEDSGHVYLLDSNFDEELDDYSESYSVYEVKAQTSFLPIVLSQWNTIEKRLLGHFPVADVEFDPTKRRELNEALLSNLSKKC